MGLTHATTTDISQATTGKGLHDLNGAGLGNARARQVLATAYRRIMDAGCRYLAPSTDVTIGGVNITLHHIDFTRLPQPLKRRLVQLKCSDINLPDEESIPGLKQFVGSLEDQHLYFIEHPEHIFLAHMGQIIAYANQ